MSRRIIWGAFAFAVMLTTAGCGSDGAAGQPGEAGAPGQPGAQGASGEAGAPGAPGTTVAVGDGGVTIPVSCLSPCHGFNGVVTQFHTSKHYIAYVQNLGGAEAVSWTTPGAACGNCHAIDGLAQRVAGNVGTAAGTTVTNLAHGELEYGYPDSGVATESTYAGSAVTAEVYCTTCHAISNANDPHKTGMVWKPGSFPLVVPTGATDLSFVEKSPPDSGVTGTLVPGLADGGSQGTSNTCVWCHRSRKDIATYITPSNKITSTRWGPHEGPQADVFSGVGGYQFTGKSYGQSTHQLKLQCIDCHMATVADNANVPDHSFQPQLSTCLNCHATAKNFDVNGGESLVFATMNELRVLLNNAGVLTRSSAAPYLPIQASDLTDPASDLTLDLTRPNGALDGGNVALTADQAGALYNYLLLARGGGKGVHNTKYTQQLIYDSIIAMGGTPVAVAVRPQ